MFSSMRLAGILMAFSVLSSLACGLIGLSVKIPELFQLFAAVLLWITVPTGVKRVSMVLLVGGVLAGVLAPHHVMSLDAFCKNQQLIAMLAAIGLLRYSPKPEVSGQTPMGPRALWQTMFGLHWLGAIINLSALAIFADRLADRNDRLSSFQGIMLARSQGLAALWSPFFVAMAFVLTYAPGADYRVLFLWGLPFSQLLLTGMTWRTVRAKAEEVSNFQGYSFRPSTLIPPAGLAIGVIIFHLLSPRLSILTIITLLAPCYPMLANRERKPGELLKWYVIKDLPQMGPEIVLFVSAGVFGSGLSALISGNDFSLSGNFNPLLIICVSQAVIILASSVGIHPVVGITVVGGVLSSTWLPPDFLALGLLFGWALGVLINPISGLHILLSGRYAFPSEKVWQCNFSFIFVAYIASCGWFWIYSCIVGTGPG